MTKPTANPIRDLAEALNPRAGALGESLPFALTPSTSKAPDAIARAFDFDEEPAPPARCRGCGAQFEIGESDRYCGSCLDEGRDVPDSHRDDGPLQHA